jgi:hypothetical protein
MPEISGYFASFVMRCQPQLDSEEAKRRQRIEKYAYDFPKE